MEKGDASEYRDMFIHWDKFWPNGEPTEEESEKMYRRKPGGCLLYTSEWFFRYIMQMQVSVCNEVVYITDHHAELSYHMADLIKDILKGEPMPAHYPEDYTNLMETGW